MPSYAIFPVFQAWSQTIIRIAIGTVTGAISSHFHCDPIQKSSALAAKWGSSCPLRWTFVNFEVGLPLEKELVATRRFPQIVV